MRKGTWAAVAGLAIAAAAVAGCAPSSSPATSAPASSSVPASQPPASPPASSPASQPSSAAPADVTLCAFPVVSCQGSASKVEPATILLSGDSSLFLSDVTWTSWGAATAQGSGTLNVDGCTPNCAQGALSRYAATITVTGLTPYGSGMQAYATMTVTAPGKSYSQVFTSLVP